ncbi:MAG: DUF1616 domain-containing protein [Staphylothermus sp.]|nr:DUF1616 domain-containing protein [Staphylothermus sp.]
MLYSVYKEVLEGRIKLVDPNPPKSFYEYLFRLDYSLWFWVVVVLVSLTLLSIILTSIVEGIIYLRYILGSIYVLFLPGYVTIEALYPLERELSPLERLALSIGLSLALVPLIGLVLNYTPWGIRLEPILVSMSFYILLVSISAAYRKYVFISRH